MKQTCLLEKTLTYMIRATAYVSAERPVYRNKKYCASSKIANNTLNINFSID